MADEVRARVVVAGAGPAGIATALQLARRGVEDVVLLDGADFPRDKTCGSGLGPRCVAVLKDLGVWDTVAPLAYRIDGMVLHTPDGSTVDLPSDGIEVAVCLRRDLDHALLSAARDRGVRFVPKVKVAELIREGGRTRGIVADDGRRFVGDLTVVATGAHAPLAVDPRKPVVVSTIMGWWEDVPFRPHWLEMVYDPAIAPYYGWLFPEGENRVNIGITYLDPDVKQHARKLFEDFLARRFGDRLKGARRIGGYRGHPIVTSWLLPKLHDPGRFVVGEAGRMVHPATGEGIAQGMRSGLLAADAIADVVLRGWPERAAAARYQAACTAAFTPSFLAGGAFLQLARTSALDRVAALSRSPRWQAATRTVLAKL
jgi:geranylgeranyl reductase family protein